MTDYNLKRGVGFGAFTDGHYSLAECKLSTTLWCQLGISMRDFSNAAPHKLRIWLTAIEKLLSRERNRGVARHYRYDLNRHIALAAAKRAICARLAKTES